MKRWSFLIAILPLLGACSLVPDPQPLPVEPLTIDLGGFPIDEALTMSAPFTKLTTLVLSDSLGNRFDFHRSHAIHYPQYVFRFFFPHPEDDRQTVTYRVTGDLYEYQYTCYENGIRIRIAIEPGICSDPQLETRQVVRPMLNVYVYGFSNGYYDIDHFPLFSLDLEDESVCLESTGSKQSYPQVRLLDRTFFNVIRKRTNRRNLQSDLYFNREKGVVGFRNNFVFWSLAEAF